VIVFDRIQMLVPSFGSGLGLRDILKIKRPYIVFIGVCTFSVLINITFFFLVTLPTTTVLVDYGFTEINVYTFYSIGTNVAWLTRGQPGYIVQLFIYTFKNIVTFLFEAVLNVISLVLFKRHLAQKTRLVAGAPRLSSAAQSNQRNRVSSIVAPVVHIRPISSVGHHLGGSGSSSHSAGVRNMALLVLFKAITGFIHNVLLLTFTVYVLIYPKPTFTLKILQFCAYFASTLRHAVSFPQFYAFNLTFRKEARLALSKMNFLNKSVRVQPSNTGS
jgi:hypothetical protein